MAGDEGGAAADRGEPPFERAAILGIGLMGGSLGLTLRDRGLARVVVGWDPNPDVLLQARALGAIDTIAPGPEAAVGQADAVFLAAPVNVIPGLLADIAPFVRPDALISDLGSTKQRIVEVGERLFGPGFVGGHPMAGSAAGGIRSAHAGLFAAAAWAIVREQPFALETDPAASRLHALILACDARPVLLDAARHDRIVALVSHLPHVLSFAFARAVEADEDAVQACAMSGGSYRDLTRVAGSNPLLWRDILLENRAFVLTRMEAYEQRFQSVKQALEDGEPDALLAALENGMENL